MDSHDRIERRAENRSWTADLSMRAAVAPWRNRDSDLGPARAQANDSARPPAR